MQSFIARSWLCCVFLAFLAAAWVPLAHAEPTGASVTRIPYAEVDGQRLDLYLHRPAEGERSPLVVWIHGGGWHSGSPTKCPIAWLTDHGFAVASVQYRLTDVATFPAQIHDCKAALRWLRAHADEYQLSETKIAVAGSSAGGHLAALMGTSGGVDALEGTVGDHLDASSRVDAVVDYYGPTDFVLRAKTQPRKLNEPGQSVYKLLGGSAADKPELVLQASPVTHVSADDPPMLVFHGDEDRTVFLNQSQRMVEVYRDAGLDIELHVLQGKGHGGRDFFRGDSRDRLLRFLAAQLIVADLVH